MELADDLLQDFPGLDQLFELCLVEVLSLLKHDPGLVDEVLVLELLDLLAQVLVDPLLVLVADYLDLLDLLDQVLALVVVLRHERHQ